MTHLFEILTFATLITAFSAHCETETKVQKQEKPRISVVVFKKLAHFIGTSFFQSAKLGSLIFGVTCFYHTIISIRTGQTRSDDFQGCLQVLLIMIPIFVVSSKIETLLDKSLSGA